MFGLTNWRHPGFVMTSVERDTDTNEFVVRRDGTGPVLGRFGCAFDAFEAAHRIAMTEWLAKVDAAGPDG